MAVHKAIAEIRAHRLLGEKLYAGMMGFIGFIAFCVGFHQMITTQTRPVPLYIMVAVGLVLTILAIFAILHKDRR